MSWSIGYDFNWHRDVGYGVPAWCDQPDCDTKIDRGLSYVCGGEPDGGEAGCGLHFCGNHLGYAYTIDGLDDLKDENGNNLPQLCERCIAMHQNPDDPPPPFNPKPDHPEWVEWKLADPSWQQWRDENPAEVAKLHAS